MKIIKNFTLTGAVLFLAMFANDFTFAGKLRDFEKSSTGKATEKSNSSGANETRPSNSSSSSGSSGRGHSSGGHYHRHDRYDDYYYDDYHYDDGYSDSNRNFRRDRCRKLLPKNIENYDENFIYYACRDGSIVKRKRGANTANGKAGRKIRALPPRAQLPPKTGRDMVLSPNVMMGISFGELDSSLDLRDVEFGIGHKNIFASFQQNKILEDYIEDGVSVNDTLKVERTMLNLRFSPSESSAVSLGLGRLSMSGVNATSSTAARVRGMWMFADNLAIELDYAESLETKLNLRESHVSFLYIQDFFALNFGVRSFVTSGAASIDLTGPYLGLSISY